MLLVKITGYIVPVAEQPQASLTPVISVENLADEGAVITGLIRIYRESTGLMIYSSELAVTQLDRHSTTNIAALTPFDPPAPADDDYFVKADITATSYLPGPPTHDSLGAWHFDIKTPPMGATPAGHAVTHELGGSDPVNVAGLVGNPDPHAASHQNGGSDELDLVGMSGLLADAQTPLGHHVTHEDGGVDEVSHGDLEGLADDDHPQYRLRDEIFYERDFLNCSSSSLNFPWLTVPLATGTFSAIAVDDALNHPGIGWLRSSINADSGFMIRTEPAVFRIAGTERTDFIIRPQELALTTLRAGFVDSTSSAAPVDGCYIEMDQVGGIDGVIVGKARSNSVESVTGTNYTLVTNTWYRLRIIVNLDATQVDFYLFAEDGTLLWTDFLTTNIPTGPGRVTGHGLYTTSSGTTAVRLVDVDYLNLRISRTLVR